MSTSIDQAFVKQFEREVHLDYQRQGSKLRGTVRTVNGVRGKSTTFQLVGKGSAGTKARHGLVPVMNLDHSNVECTLVDRYAGEWVDKLDELKINHDERGVISQSMGWAFGRTTDEDLLAALASATGNSTTVSVASEKAIRNSIIKALKELHERDVPDDGRTYGVIPPSMWAAFMTIDQFVSADYVGGELPYKASMSSLKSWMGIHWMTHTGLTKTSNDRLGHLYHYTAVGHAIQADVSMDITWHGDRAAHFFAGSMSMGACLIDNDGVQDLVIDESTALPTS